MGILLLIFAITHSDSLKKNKILFVPKKTVDQQSKVRPLNQTSGSQYQ